MRLFTLLLLAALVASSAFALPEVFNYDESKVPDFTLAGPLALENGDKVADAETWKNERGLKSWISLRPTFTAARRLAGGDLAKQ